MRLQKHFAYEYEGTKHFKYLVIISEKIIKELGWKEGENLLAKIKNNYLILEQGIAKKSKKEIIPYKEFREIIKKELEKNPFGLTWTEIRDKIGLEQKVPNNRWVRRMEKDINLVREKIDRRTIWKLQR